MSNPSSQVTRLLNSARRDEPDAAADPRAALTHSRDTPVNCPWHRGKCRGAPVSEPVTRPNAAPGEPARLVDLVYDQLRKIAQQRMGGERAGHTLQATALVHEVYLKLSE